MEISMLKFPSVISKSDLLRSLMKRERERRRERERETVMASFASSFGRVLKRDLVGIAKAAAFFYVIHEHVVEIAYVSH